MNDMKNAIVDRLMDRKYVDDEKIIKDIDVEIVAEKGSGGYDDVYAVVEITVKYNNGDREIVNLASYEFEDMVGV